MHMVFGFGRSLLGFVWFFAMLVVLALALVPAFIATVAVIAATQGDWQAATLGAFVFLGAAFMWFSLVKGIAIAADWLARL